MKIVSRTLMLAVAAAAVSVSACSTTIDNHGNAPKPEQVEQIKPGKTTRDDIQALLGSPSSVSTYGDESWYYVSSRTATTSFFKPERLDQRVFGVVFDSQGVVKTIVTRGMEDGENVQAVARETPTAGKELSVLEQLVGNVGRFSKDPAEK